MRSVVVGILGAIGGAVLCGAVSVGVISYELVSHAEVYVPHGALTVPLITTGAGALAGGALGVFRRERLWAFLIGALLGALTPYGLVAAHLAWLAMRPAPSEAYEGLLAFLGGDVFPILSPVDALAGGVFGGYILSSRVRVGASLIGAFVGAVLPPATVLAVILLTRGGRLDWVAQRLGIWTLIVLSPVTAPGGGAFGAYIARSPVRWKTASLLGAFIGAVLPLATILAVVLVTSDIMPNWWPPKFVMRPLGWGRPGWEEHALTRALLIVSPVGALVVGTLGVYIAWHLPRDDEAEGPK